MHGTFWPRALSAALLTSLLITTAAAGPVSGPAMASSPAPAPAAAPATVPSGAAMAAAAAASLQRMYNPSTGLFCRKLNANCWWDSANELTALIDYSKQAGSRRYLGDLARTYVRGQYAGPDGRSRGPFTDNWFDDDAWWALAWLDAYEWQPRDTRYLTMAENLFSYIFKHGWSTKECHGGVWQTVQDGKDAIANGLYLELAARLYLVTRHRAYLTKAQDEWRWFKSSGMIHVIPASSDRIGRVPGGELLYDHVNKACVVGGAQFWTYNQGVFVGGLDDMYRATGNPSYLSQAEAIASCVTSLACGGNTKHANPPVDVGGILTEPCMTSDCGGTGNSPPMLQFKGVFMRNLYCLNQTVRSSAYQTFIADNAISIFAHDQNAMHQFGFSWAGPWDFKNGATEATEGSALSGLNANIGGNSPASC
jgi:Glycosyl hydrolase family 76